MKTIKNNVFGFILGIIVCITSFVYASSTISSSSVSYSNTNSGGSYLNVQDTIDELYTRADDKYQTGYDAGYKVGYQAGIDYVKANPSSAGLKKIEPKTFTVSDSQWRGSSVGLPTISASNSLPIEGWTKLTVTGITGTGYFSKNGSTYTRVSVGNTFDITGLKYIYLKAENETSSEGVMLSCGISVYLE